MKVFKLNDRETEIKTKVIYLSSHVRLTKIKKYNNTFFW